MKTIILTLAFALQLNAFANTEKVNCESEENYPVVTKAELEKMVQDKTAFVIDVNGNDSFKESHIPGAVHFKAIEKKFANALPKDKSTTIVAYCGGPECTAWKKAAQKACKMGYKNVKHFKDGISGWNKKST